VLNWWNPYAKKLYKRTLKSRTIKVMPNPNLGMLETMRDSLKVSITVEPGGIEAAESLTIFGLSTKQFILLLGSLLVVLYVMFRIAKNVNRKLKLKKEAYKVGEAYFFRRFLKAVKKGNSDEIMNTLYRWIDKLQLEEPTVQYFVSKYAKNELSQDLVQLMNSTNTKQSIKLKLSTKPWIEARLKFLNDTKNDSTKDSYDWVNP